MYLQTCSIDYIRFAIQVNDTVHQSEIKCNLKNIANRLANSLNTPLNQIIHNKNGYEIFLRVPLLSDFHYARSNEETPHLVIKCSYINGSRYFLAVECKGHPYNKQEWYLVRLWLEEILGEDLLKIYENDIYITNFDIAIGVNFLIEDYLFDFVWGQKSGWFTSASGQIETIYIQPHNKRLEICIYNRKAKIINRGIKKNITEPSRIELRFGKRKIPLYEFLNTLDFIPKALKRTRIYNLKYIVQKSDISQDQTIAVQATGLVPYLRKISKYRREKFRKALKPYLNPAIEFSLVKPLWESELEKIKKIRLHKKYKGNKYDILRDRFIKTYFK